ncbi:MAG: hypothetical protein O7C59_11470 [Rickettsia endosymbiont of Ixodes persulcatus]|nr:hypothetical protein [Rickettsia endosymbiont of Ixodes persulcatus]
MKIFKSDCNASAKLRQLNAKNSSLLLDAKNSKKIRKNLDYYNLSADNPGERLFLEIDFLHLGRLQSPPQLEDFKLLLSNAIYRIPEINSGNFLLHLLLDKTTDPATIVHLLQGNSFSLSKAAMAITTACLVEKDLSFIILLVQIIDCRIDKTVDSERLFMEMLNKYSRTLKIISGWEQQINSGINFTGIYDGGDFLKEKKEIEEKIKPLKVLRYWETEIKKQIIESIQEFYSKKTIKPYMHLDSVSEKTSNSCFFQPKTLLAATAASSLPDKLLLYNT